MYFIGSCVVLFNLALRTPTREQDIVAYGIGLGVTLLLFAANLAIGVGLQGLQPWARWVDVVHFVLTLALMLVGLCVNAFMAVAMEPGRAFGALFVGVLALIPGYALYLLIGSKGTMVFSREYRAIIERTPHIRHRMSRAFKIVLGICLGCFVVFTFLAFAVFLVAMIARYGLIRGRSADIVGPHPPSPGPSWRNVAWVRNATPASPKTRTIPMPRPCRASGRCRWRMSSRAAHPDFGEIFSRSWEIYKEQMWPCIGAVFLWFFMVILSQVLIGGAQAFMGNGQAPSAAVLLVAIGAMLLGWLLQLWIYCGITLFMLHIARGQEAPFGLIFAGGRFILPIIGSSILLGLLIFGVVVVCVIPGGIAMAFLAKGNQPVGIILLILSVLVGYVVAFVVYIRFSQYFYLIIDRKAGVVDALQVSYRVTRGNGLMIFVIILVAGLINLAGILACGVGVFFTVPYSFLVLVVTYLAVTGQAAAGGKGEPLAELEPL